MNNGGGWCLGDYRQAIAKRRVASAGVSCTRPGPAAWARHLAQACDGRTPHLREEALGHVQVAGLRRRRRLFQFGTRWRNVRADCPAARAAGMLLVSVLVEPVRILACTVGGNSALLKLSHKLVRPLSAPVLLMARPTIVPTTVPNRKQPSPPVATVMPVAATTAAVATAVIAIFAATSQHTAEDVGLTEAVRRRLISRGSSRQWRGRTLSRSGVIRTLPLVEPA
ncbi:hypothetical protein C4J97_5395 [Pseudomonas orientalis]|nr:hypothetical protein C4J97_5395 [Pseudomonas orientalis]